MGSEAVTCYTSTLSSTEDEENNPHIADAKQLYYGTDTRRKSDQIEGSNKNNRNLIQSEKDSCKPNMKHAHANKQHSSSRRKHKKSKRNNACSENELIIKTLNEENKILRVQLLLLNQQIMNLRKNQDISTISPLDTLTPDNTN
eukprot:751049_1